MADFFASKDHQLMAVSIHTPEHDSTPIANPTRFQTRFLRSAILRSIVCDLYNQSRQQLVDAMTQLNATVELPSSEYRSKIDSIYEKLIQVLSDICERVLKKFSVQTNRDRSAEILGKIGTLNQTQAIMAFKQARMSGKRCSIKSRNDDLSPQEDAFAFFDGVFSSKDSRPPLPPPLNDCIALAVSTNSVVTKIRSYPKRKCCGEDGLHILILRALCLSKLPADLSQLFSWIIAKGTSPSLWNTAIIHPVPKSASAETIDNHRPIALTLLLRRIFEAIVLDWLQTEESLKEKVKLNFSQAGFRSKESTMLNIATLHDLQLTEGGTLLFLDLKQAYDRVDISLLLEKLQHRGIPSNLVRLIYSMFATCKVKIAVNQRLTQPVEMLTGLLQGSILSPLLFDIYIDSLASALNGDVPTASPRSLLFADDLTAHFRRHTPAAIIQRDADTITGWCETHNMIASMGKTKYVSDEKDDLQILISNSLVDRVDTYVYLGMDMGKRGISFVRFLERCLEKATKTLQGMKNYQQIWPEGIKTALYRVFCRPQLEYGAPLVQASMSIPGSKEGEALLRPLNELQNEALQFIFDTSRATVTEASLAGLPNPKDRLQSLHASFAIHIRNAPDDHPASIRFHNGLHPPESLIGRCRNLAMVNEYDQYRRLCIQNRAKPISHQSWLRINIVGKLTTEYGALSSLVPRNARTAGGMDTLLLHDDARERKTLILWRRNKLWFLKRCPACDGNFSRKHLVTCAILGNETPVPVGPCNLDRLINNQKYSAAVELIEGLPDP